MELLFATKMDYLRFSARMPRMDMFRNEIIITKIGMKKDMLQEIKEQQLRWSGHVMRMEDCRIALRVAEWSPQGTRRRGLRVNTWKDGIRDSTQSRNLRDEECFDREVWKKMI
jgi:hypothetical protein